MADLQSAISAAAIANKVAGATPYAAKALKSAYDTAHVVRYNMTRRQADYMAATTPGELVFEPSVRSSDCGSHPHMAAARWLCYDHIQSDIDRTTRSNVQGRVIILYATAADYKRFRKNPRVFFVVSNYDAKDGLRGTGKFMNIIDKNRVFWELEDAYRAAKVAPFNIAIWADSIYNHENYEVANIMHNLRVDKAYNIMFMPSAVLCNDVVHKPSREVHDMVVKYHPGLWPENEFFVIQVRDDDSGFVDVAFRSPFGAADHVYSHSLATWASKRDPVYECDRAYVPKHGNPADRSWVNERIFASADMVLMKLAPATSTNDVTVQFYFPEIDRHHLLVDLWDTVHNSVNGVKKEWKALFRTGANNVWTTVRSKLVAATQAYIQRIVTNDPEKDAKYITTHLHKTLDMLIASAEFKGYVNTIMRDDIKQSLPALMMLAHSHLHADIVRRLDAMKDSSWLADLVRRIDSDALDSFLRFIRGTSGAEKWMLPGMDHFTIRMKPRFADSVGREPTRFFFQQPSEALEEIPFDDLAAEMLAGNPHRTLWCLGRQCVDVMNDGDCAMHAALELMECGDSPAQLRQEAYDWLQRTGHYMAGTARAQQWDRAGVHVTEAFFEAINAVRGWNIKCFDGEPGANFALSATALRKISTLRADDPVVVVYNNHCYALKSMEPKHDGQRKCLLRERAFLGSLGTQDQELMVLYIGSGDGYHIPELLREFPKVKLVSFDRAEPKVTHPNWKHFPHNFSDADVASFVGNNLVVIVDMRTGSDGHVKTSDIAHDNKDVARWMQALRPRRALLKGMAVWEQEYPVGRHWGYGNGRKLVDLPYGEKDGFTYFGRVDYTLPPMHYDGLELSFVTETGKGNIRHMKCERYFRLLNAARFVRNAGKPTWKTVRVNVPKPVAAQQSPPKSGPAPAQSGPGPAPKPSINFGSGKCVACGKVASSGLCSACNSKYDAQDSAFMRSKSRIAAALLSLDKKGRGYPKGTVNFSGKTKKMRLQINERSFDDLRERLLAMEEQGGALEKISKQIQEQYKQTFNGIDGEFDIDVECVNGLPGTGKSELLREIAELAVARKEVVLVFLPFKKLIGDYKKLALKYKDNLFIKTTHRAAQFIGDPKFANPSLVLYDEMGAVDASIVELMVTANPNAEHIFFGDCNQTRLRLEEGKDVFEWISENMTGDPFVYELTANFRNPKDVVLKANLVTGVNMKPFGSNEGKVSMIDATSGQNWRGQMESRFPNWEQTWHQMAFSNATNAFVYGDDEKHGTVRSSQGMTVDNAVLHVGPSCVHLANSPPFALVALTRARHNLVVIVHSCGGNSNQEGLAFAARVVTGTFGGGAYNSPVEQMDVHLDNMIPIENYAEKYTEELSLHFDELLALPGFAPDGMLVPLNEDILDPPDIADKPSMGALDAYKDAQELPEEAIWAIERAQNSKLPAGQYRVVKDTLPCLREDPLISKHVVQPNGKNSTLQLATEAMEIRTVAQRVARVKKPKPLDPQLQIDIETAVADMYAKTKGRTALGTTAVHEAERFVENAKQKKYFERLRGKMEAEGPDLNTGTVLGYLPALKTKVRASIKQQVKVANVNKTNDPGKTGQSINSVEPDNLMRFAVLIRLLAQADKATFDINEGEHKIMLKQRLSDAKWRARVKAKLSEFRCAQLLYIDGKDMDAGQTEAGWYAYFYSRALLMEYCPDLALEYGPTMLEMFDYFMQANLNLKVIGEFITAFSSFGTPSGCSFTFDVTTWQSVFYSWLQVIPQGPSLSLHSGDDGAKICGSFLPNNWGRMLIERMTNAELLMVECKDSYFEFCGDIIVADKEFVDIAPFFTRKAYKLLASRVTSEAHLVELHKVARDLGDTSAKDIWLNALALSMDGYDIEQAVSAVETLRQACASYGRTKVSDLASNLIDVKYERGRNAEPYFFF